MSVKRYDYGMVSDEGMWVQYPDYAALETRVKELTIERDRYKNLYEALQQTTKEVLLHGEQERDRLEKAYGIVKANIEMYGDLNSNYALARAEAARKGE